MAPFLPLQPGGGIPLVEVGQPRLAPTGCAACTGAPRSRTLWPGCPRRSGDEDQRRELVDSLRPLAETFGLSFPQPEWVQLDDEDWSSPGSSTGRRICGPEAADPSCVVGGLPKSMPIALCCAWTQVVRLAPAVTPPHASVWRRSRPTAGGSDRCRSGLWQWRAQSGGLGVGCREGLGGRHRFLGGSAPPRTPG